MNNHNTIVLTTLVIILILGVAYTANKINTLQADNINLREQLYDYQNSLDQANTAIQEANTQITDAKEYQDSGYEAMNDVLLNLKTVEIIYEP